MARSSLIPPSATKPFLYGMLVSLVVLELLFVTLLPPLDAKQIHLLGKTVNDDIGAIIPDPKIYSSPLPSQKFAIQYPSQWGEPTVQSGDLNASEVVFGSLLSIRVGTFFHPDTHRPLTIDGAVATLFPRVAEVSPVTISGIEGKKVSYSDADSGTLTPKLAVVLTRPGNDHQLVILTIHDTRNNDEMKIARRSIDTFTLLNG